MSKPPADWKAWAKHLRGAIPGEVAVRRYWDEPKQHQLDIFTSRNDEGTVAATIGLMEFDQSRNADLNVYTELLLDHRGPNDLIGNVLSTISFYVMKDGWKVAPGVVFEEMISMYIPDSPTRHVVFLPPFQWGAEMTCVQLASKTVFPLLAIPITQSEMEMIYRDGSDVLENRWAETDCDVLDWNRASVT